MAYLELNNKKLLRLINEEVVESETSDFLEGLIRIVTKALKVWDMSYIDDEVLRRLRKALDKAMGCYVEDDGYC